MRIAGTIEADEYDPADQRLVIVDVEDNEAVKSAEWKNTQYRFDYEEDLPVDLPEDTDGAWTMLYHEASVNHLQSVDEETTVADGVMENAPAFPPPIQAKEIVEDPEYGDEKLVLLAVPAYSDKLFDHLNWDITHHTIHDDIEEWVIDADTTSIEHFEQIARDQQVTVNGLEEFRASRA